MPRIDIEEAELSETTTNSGFGFRKEAASSN